MAVQPSLAAVITATYANRYWVGSIFQSGVYRDKHVPTPSWSPMIEHFSSDALSIGHTFHRTHTQRFLAGSLSVTPSGTGHIFIFPIGQTFFLLQFALISESAYRTHPSSDTIGHPRLSSVWPLRCPPSCPLL